MQLLATTLTMLGGGSNLIIFTINGTQYQAEEGMTWGEWIDSEYNVNGKFYIELDNAISNGVYRIGTEEYYVFSSDIIKKNYNYWLVG